MFKIVRVVLVVLAVIVYLYILLGALKRCERRRIMIPGEAEDGGGNRVFHFILFAAFVGTILVSD